MNYLPVGIASYVLLALSIFVVLLDYRRGELSSVTLVCALVVSISVTVFGATLVGAEINFQLHLLMQFSNSAIVCGVFFLLRYRGKVGVTRKAAVEDSTGLRPIVGSVGFLSAAFLTAYVGSPPLPECNTARCVFLNWLLGESMLTNLLYISSFVGSISILCALVCLSILFRKVIYTPPR
ncbi:hypothetical protein PDO_5265 [Rhizobium sp. PDO1-076]|nr:hypothetical protein PDO_5265 [Rhizobium sp. PDO1-076]